MEHSRERWVYGILLIYAIGFLLYPPRVLIIADEFNYVAQAMAFARGALTIPGADPLYPPNPLRVVSNYPPGTSLLQAPLVALAGWRAAAGLSVIALIAATVVMMRWLRESNYDSRFAAMVPGFVATLFFARTAMSDVPSAALVAVTLWLTWNAQRGTRWSFGAGFTVGAGLLFRETNLLLVAPCFAGALVRKRGHRRALLAGLAVGVAARFAASAWLFGSPFYVRDSGYGFSLGSAMHNLPQYGVILLLMFPIGALLPFLYRGPWATELRWAIGLYVCLFLFYDYGAVQESGGVRGLLLVSRYMVPALPILVLMAADVYPRLVTRSSGGVGAIARRVTPLLLAGIMVAAFLIHPVMRRQEAAALSIVSAIQQGIAPGTPVITNHHATLKYLSPVYGPHPLVLRSYITAGDVPRYYAQQPELALVFFDRTDSDMFREDARQNGAFLAELEQRCSLQSTHDAPHGAGTRLRILKITRCG